MRHLPGLGSFFRQYKNRTDISLLGALDLSLIPQNKRELNTSHDTIPSERIHFKHAQLLLTLYCSIFPLRLIKSTNE
jgi:hypothetical protein